MALSTLLDVTIYENTKVVTQVSYVNITYLDFLKCDLRLQDMLRLTQHKITPAYTTVLKLVK